MTAYGHIRNFWNAAHFARHAQPPRDRDLAIRVLEQVARKSEGTVKSRAETLLKEIANDTDQHAARAN